jgi:hypothetical protein
VKVIIFVAVGAVGMLITGIAGAQSWVCVADHATGFKYDGNKWNAAHFKTDEKFLVTKSDNPKTAKWVVKKVGESFPTAFCEEDFTPSGALRCSGFEEFRFNKKNLRFMSLYAIGYVTDGIGLEALGKEGQNTPALTIGTCAQL